MPINDSITEAQIKTELAKHNAPLSRKPPEREFIKTEIKDEYNNTKAIIYHLVDKGFALFYPVRGLLKMFDENLDNFRTYPVKEIVAE